MGAVSNQLMDFRRGREGGCECDEGSGGQKSITYLSSDDFPLMKINALPVKWLIYAHNWMRVTVNLLCIILGTRHSLIVSKHKILLTLHLSKKRNAPILSPRSVSGSSLGRPRLPPRPRPPRTGTAARTRRRCCSKAIGSGSSSKQKYQNACPWCMQVYMEESK